MSETTQAERQYVKELLDVGGFADEDAAPISGKLLRKLLADGDSLQRAEELLGDMRPEDEFIKSITAENAQQVMWTLQSRIDRALGREDG